MTPVVLHLISLSAKIALLGGLAWLQLYLLRRAPAASRSRLCLLALIAMVLFAAGELVVAPKWLAQRTVFHFTSTASSKALPAAIQTNVSTWLGLLWIAGAGVMLARAMAGRITLAVLRRRSTLWEQISGLEQISGSEQLSDLDVRIGAVGTPILTGLLRPAIVLPASASGWTEEQRRMVLTHEITHFRQGDCWSNLLAQCVRAAFWFHPVVWLLVSRMSREQELTCDEAVVASGHSPHDYAAFLLDTVRNLHSREMFACAMAGSGAQSLKRRFANLLDTKPRPALTRRVAASMVVFASLAITLAVVRPVWSQNETGDRAYRVGHGTSYPAVIYKVDPEYSQAARAAKYSGTVLLQIVVDVDGKAKGIKVVKGVGYGLDQKAIEAVQKWTFRPGKKNGIAVPVYATVEVNFRLL